MAKADYAQLDQGLLTRIGSGKVTFAGLVDALLAEATAFCAGPRDEPMRVIDRRLQALRKQGKIGYDTKLGWRMRGPDGSYINHVEATERKG